MTFLRVTTFLFLSCTLVSVATALKCHTCESIGSRNFADCVSKKAEELQFVFQRTYGAFKYSEDPDMCIMEFRSVPSGEDVVVRAGIKRDPRNLIPLQTCINLDVNKTPNVFVNNVTLCTCGSVDFCNALDTADSSVHIHRSGGDKIIPSITVALFLAISALF